MSLEEDSKMDKMAVEMLLKAPMMSKEELDETIFTLRKMAIKKSGRRNARFIMDSWADTAYDISMKC
ncbi:hypothetical protein [Methanococcus maripaludis]|jgi:hypothetical protein|uniref:Uncharacterized protein n=5 Tax=Methanococcus maripaludis TaxID=39152 RepID=Q6LZI2_METMP|nr:hypothetical protein [Methanococcus maripaludis]MDK2929480.1 hypothetical protein [Methanococcus sp.]AEK19525.1 hypothetical protein GYY_03230 [Methanococcus maripaludis X1]AVB75751.1 hypothetical protein MMJJ_03340 [Methanococcus maripaludis]MBA2846457.1 hypothetical protein [Methanococcus maripaludis]MBA2850979.1 hypothetical protein [Methanococcus maripaludis]